MTSQPLRLTTPGEMPAPRVDSDSAIVIAEVQSITFNEFLPALLGANVITPYQGYDPTVNPDIATEFSHLIVAQTGWEEVAEHALTWAEKHVEMPAQVSPLGATA